MKFLEGVGSEAALRSPAGSGTICLAQDHVAKLPAEVQAEETSLCHRGARGLAAAARGPNAAAGGPGRRGGPGAAAGASPTPPATPPPLTTHPDATDTTGAARPSVPRQAGGGRRRPGGTLSGGAGCARSLPSHPRRAAPGAPPSRPRAAGEGGDGGHGRTDLVEETRARRRGQGRRPPASPHSERDRHPHPPPPSLPPWTRTGPSPGRGSPAPRRLPRAGGEGEKEETAAAVPSKVYVRAGSRSRRAPERNRLPGRGCDRRARAQQLTPGAAGRGAARPGPAPPTPPPRAQQRMGSPPIGWGAARAGGGGAAAPPPPRVARGPLAPGGAAAKVGGAGTGRLQLSACLALGAACLFAARREVVCFRSRGEKVVPVYCLNFPLRAGLGRGWCVFPVRLGGFVLLGWGWVSSVGGERAALSRWRKDPSGTG